MKRRTFFMPTAGKVFGQRGIHIIFNLPEAFPYEEVVERLGDLNARGVTLREGQTLWDLYEERVPLYEKASQNKIGTARKPLPLKMLFPESPYDTFPG